MQKTIICLLILFLTGHELLSQSTVLINIKDDKFDNPLAFVFLTDSLKTKGGQTDINGAISLQLKKGDCIFVQLYGYKNKKETWEGENPWIIHLESNDLVLGELVVTIKEDPAYKVIAKCIKQSSTNNPVEKLDYQFEQYSKMIVDFERNGDSTFLKTFDDKKLLLSETIALHQHRAPNENKETILANQMSGFEFPQSTIIGSQMQSFSAYEPDFQILDRVLISPLGPRSIDRYEYKMIDTLISNNDSIFVIQYNPKKRFQSNGLIGIMHIQSPEFALIQLTAEPFEKESSYYIKIQQKLNKQWNCFFPSEMNSYYKLTNSTPEIFGEIQTQLKNIELRKFESKDFGAVVFDFPQSANTITDNQWEDLRYTPLSAEESNTYSFMDSIGRAYSLDARVNRLASLIQGQWMIGNVNMDLFQLYKFNRFEGSRLGIGLSTNSKFHERWKLDGNTAFGFKDKQTKFGTGLGWTSSNNRFHFRLGYIDDVQESGRNGLNSYRRNINQQVYEFFVTKMDYIHGVTLDVQIPLFKSAQLFYQQSNLKKTPHISFTKNNPQQYSIVLNRLLFRWTPGEKRRRVLDKEIVLNGYWPIFQLGISQATISQNKTFIRHQFELEKTFHSAYWGDVKVNMECGKTIFDAPFNELNALRGSWNNHARVTISVPESFETALNNQWYAREYAHFFVRYKWKTPIYQHPQSAPKITMLLNGGWGKLGLKDYAPEGVTDYPKGFFETGLGINDLVMSKTGGLGIGCFTRLGQYSDPQVQKNIVLKITTNFLF